MGQMVMAITYVQVISAITLRTKNMKPINFFATPNSMKDLEDWLAAARDPMVTTAAMMMYNLLVSNFDLTEKKELEADG